VAVVATTPGLIRPVIRRREPLVAPRGWPADAHPVLRRVYAARGVAGPEDLPRRLAELVPPDRLGGVADAARLVADAIDEGRRIVLAGDYDADGATGCAVGLRGLAMLGAREPGYVVPNRAVHGYGLGPGLVDLIAARGADLVITVDNGIAAHAGVAAAKDRGMRVVVTDHHLAGESLPAADAIVNPNLPGDPFPSKALAGVGVLFYLLLAVRAELRARGRFPDRAAEPDLASLVDLVALGTVADMVPLDANNRLLVRAGIERIRAGRASAGVAALLAIANRRTDVVTAQDLGFAVAPRINAAGRLEDMTVGIECLRTDDPARAAALAAELDAINCARREVQAGMQAEADAAIARALAAGARVPAGLTVFDPAWHAGVVGLVASRLKDRLHRPVVAFAPAAEGSDELRGSARSVAGVHVRDVLVAIDARRPGLIPRYGGHAMAAGLSLPAAALPEFGRLFAEVVREWTSGDPGEPVIASDGELAGREVDVALALALRDGGPWGTGFEEPAFDGEFVVEDWREVGTGHLRLALRFAGCGTRIEAMHFGGLADGEPGERVRLVYQVALDEWRGASRARLLVRHREDV
jgi:single-stranded-DNA-specific exonuclease